LTTRRSQPVSSCCSLLLMVAPASSRTAWSSTNGTEWVRTPPDFDVFSDGGGMYDVVASPHGVVAVGATEYWVDEEQTLLTLRPSVWVSPDGAVTVGSDGTLVAVGSMLDDQGVAVAAVWTSSDGVTWDRVPHDPTIFGGAGELELTMWDVVADTSGLVAVGGERRSGATHPAVWTSPDGLSWNRVELDPATADHAGRFGNVAVGGEGLIATGPGRFEGIGQVTVWTSADGASWDLIAGLLGSGSTHGVIAVDQAVLVSGSVQGAGNFEAAVWAGPATPIE